jgi:hypothetical protein
MRLYALFCAAVVAGFGLAESRGVNLVPDTHHVSVPASVRGSPGGYRVYRSWGGGGFRGGK